MFVLETGDDLRGSASVAAVVDYTVHGLVGTTLTQLADGQLGNSEASLHAAGSSTDVVTSITLVNTDTSARTVELYLKPSGGTSRRLIPKTLSLGAGFSLYFDGNNIKVNDASGKLLLLSTVANLGDVGDVTVSSPADNEVLAYDTSSGKWINQTPNEAGLVAKALFDAHSILAADTDDIPAAIALAASRIPARLASGGIVAATPAQILAILTGQAGAAFDWGGQNLTNLGTLSAFTLGGTITGGNQTINNLAHIGLGNQAASAAYGIYYYEAFTITDNAEYGGLSLYTVGAKTSAVFAAFVGGVWGAGRLGAANTQNWTNVVGLRGVTSFVRTDSGTAGTITGAAAFVASMPTISAGAADAVITNYYGLYIYPLSLVGNSRLTNNYGIYIAAQTGGATLNYGIYVAGSLVYLGGGLTVVGTTTLDTGLTGVLRGDSGVVSVDTTLDADAVAAVEAAGLTLATEKAIEYTTPTADHTASGIIVTKTAGAALVFGDACYTGTDGKMEKALADDAAVTIPATHLCIATIAENAAGLFLEQGEAHDDSWAFDVGLSVYLSKDTAGLITKTMPTKVTGNQVQVLGTCVEDTTKIFWNPSPIVVEYA